MQALTGAHTKQWLFLWKCYKWDQEDNVFVLLTILSNSASTSSHVWRSRGSLAYALIICSLPGHSMGQRTWGIIHCVSRAIGPQWIRSPIDEGTGHTIPLPKHPHLDSKSHWFPPSFTFDLLPLPHSPTSFTPGCQGVVRKRERDLLFLLSQWEALLRFSGISRLLFSPPLSPP